MLHAYVARFDVTENLEKFWVFGRTKQGLSWSMQVLYVWIMTEKIVVHENHWIVLGRYQVDNPFCTASQHINLN